MKNHIHQSNLIESIDDPKEDAQSLKAWGFISKQKKIGVPELLETHRLITKNQLNKFSAGFFRHTYVQIGGELAPSPWNAQAIVSNLLLDLNEFPLNLDPIVGHIRFEHAHPFIDGNGRTGRMLLWWHQIKTGQKPTLFKNKDKETYYELFR